MQDITFSDSDLVNLISFYVTKDANYDILLLDVIFLNNLVIAFISFF